MTHHAGSHSELVWKCNCNICYCSLQEVHSVTLLLIHYLEIFFQAGLFTSLIEDRVFSYLCYRDNCSFLCSTTFYSNRNLEKENLWQLVQGLLVGMSEMRRQYMCVKVQQVPCNWRLNPTLNSLHMFTFELEDELLATSQLQKHLLEMLTRVWFFLGLHFSLPHWLLPSSTWQGGRYSDASLLRLPLS